MSEYVEFCSKFKIGEKVMYYGDVYEILDISDTPDGFAQCLLGVNENHEKWSKQWMYNDGVKKLTINKEEKNHEQ